MSSFFLSHNNYKIVLQQKYRQSWFYINKLSFLNSYNSHYLNIFSFQFMLLTLYWHHIIRYINYMYVSGICIFQSWISYSTIEYDNLPFIWTTKSLPLFTSFLCNKNVFRFTLCTGKLHQIFVLYIMLYIWYKLLYLLARHRMRIDMKIKLTAECSFWENYKHTKLGCALKSFF